MRSTLPASVADEECGGVYHGGDPEHVSRGARREDRSRAEIAEARRRKATACAAGFCSQFLIHGLTDRCSHAAGWWDAGRSGRRMTETRIPEHKHRMIESGACVRDPCLGHSRGARSHQLVSFSRHWSFFLSSSFGSSLLRFFASAVGAFSATVNNVAKSDPTVRRGAPIIAFG